MPQVNIYTTEEPIQFLLKCHTSHGDPNDEHGRYYEAGKEYLCNLELHRPCDDTNNQKCTLCWIDYNDGFGNRFAVVGNIYHSGEAYWPHFTKLFECPLTASRDEKIEAITELKCHS